MKIPYILTYTGKEFKHTDVREEDICIEDIAHALSNICRFTGHCREFYSVAQHCVIGSYFVEQQYALDFLLHDGSEAYCSDLCTPLKKLPSMIEYSTIEKHVHEVIAKKYGLSWPEPPEVKEADNRMLATESRDLFKCDYTFGPGTPYENYHIIPWSPEKAEDRYLARFDYLYEEKQKSKARSQISFHV